MLAELVDSFAAEWEPVPACRAFYDTLEPLSPVSLTMMDWTNGPREAPLWEERVRFVLPEVAASPLLAQLDNNVPVTVATRRMRRPFRCSEMDQDFIDPRMRRLFWEAIHALGGPESDGLVIPQFTGEWLDGALILGFRQRAWMDGLEGAVVAAGAVLLSRFVAPTTFATLTGRVREAVLWVAEGKTEAEIAIILGISRHTVRDYIETARKRLKARNRVELVARFLMNSGIAAPSGRRIPGLTAREHLCLFRMIYGETDQAIARSLSVSSSTVHALIESAKAKLNTTSRSQAAAELAKRGGL